MPMMGRQLSGLGTERLRVLHRT